MKFSEKFEEFQKLLGEILGLDEDFLKNVRLIYKDEDGDKIEIKNKEEYNLFIEEVKKQKKLMELFVEVKEESNMESNLLIKKYSSSLLSYVAKNSGNINNLSEDIKEQHKFIEMSDEINSNIIVNENKEKPKENIINENNINDNNHNNINNENNVDNDNENNINNENEINNENNDNNNNILIKNNNINNIIINNPNDDIENENKIILDNNINIQKNNINNIQNQPKNKQINNQNKVQMNNPQRPNIQNLHKNNHDYLYILSFPYVCIICKRGPIYRALYFCRECNMIICPQCELKVGPNHQHPLYKAQNQAQFQDLNILNITEMEKYMFRVGNKLEDAYHSVIGFFGNKNNNNNNINNNNENENRSKLPEPKGPQWVSLVQIARSAYDLGNITDIQIEQALIKCKGNVDEAVITLFGQEK